MKRTRIGGYSVNYKSGYDKFKNFVQQATLEAPEYVKDEPRYMNTARKMLDSIEQYEGEQESGVAMFFAKVDFLDAHVYMTVGVWEFLRDVAMYVDGVVWVEHDELSTPKKLEFEKNRFSATSGVVEYHEKNRQYSIDGLVELSKKERVFREI